MYSSDDKIVLCCICSGVQLAGILALLHCCFDLKSTLGGKHPSVLYYLTAAMRPRMLMTVDEEGKLLPVSVRVGQAIDVVAQACPPFPLPHIGKPCTKCASVCKHTVHML